MKKKKEDEVIRRNEIRKLLQRYSTSIRSLQALSEQETRAGEVAAVRKKKQKKKNGEEVENLQPRRTEITNLLQRCGTSMHSLRSLSIQESRRHEVQNCQAIPEGNEDEHENEDNEANKKYNDHDTEKEETEEGKEDNGTVDEDTADVSDSIQNTTLSVLPKLLAAWFDREDSDSDSKSKSN